MSNRLFGRDPRFAAPFGQGVSLAELRGETIKPVTLAAPVRPPPKPPAPPPTTAFRARYAYVRVSIKGVAVAFLPSSGRLHDEVVEVIVGVEIQGDEQMPAFYNEIRAILQYDVKEQIRSGSNDVQIAQKTEALIQNAWPGRSYFLEVGRGELDEYVQVFEPWGKLP